MAIPIAIPSLAAPRICSATGARACSTCSGVKVGGTHSLRSSSSSGRKVVWPPFASFSTLRIFLTASGSATSLPSPRVNWAIQ
jgi:hypothetical protein